MFIRVKVRTRARKESLEKIAEGRYEIHVKEKPEQNAANERVLSLLSRELGRPIKSIRFVSGQRSPSKLFEIHET